MIDFPTYAELYRKELLENCLPFWMEHSIDKVNGGFFSCLNRDGSVYDTDKFVWLQGREVWTFAMLYNKMARRPEWLDVALSGARFLLEKGHDGNFDFYFSLTADGRPIVCPYNIFSNTFACMAFAQVAKATGDEKYAEAARRTFNRILERRANPKGQWNKIIPGTRPMKDFALPMIICNMALEVEDIINDPGLIERTIDESVHEIVDVFYKPEIGVILENLSPDGSMLDCFEGRKINPGHDLEAMWFLMNIGQRRQDRKLIDKAVEIALSVIEYGWDKEYGGIFYFLDRNGYPTQELEWDQKLWWVHIESAIAMIKGYQLTGNVACLEWFERLHNYMWNHFKDAEYPEWFGYLNRTGEVLLPLKGGKWKGCFHVPRGLYQIYTILSGCKQDCKTESGL